MSIAARTETLASDLASGSTPLRSPRLDPDQPADRAQLAIGRKRRRIGARQSSVVIELEAFEKNRAVHPDEQRVSSTMS
jgi:hypothetical protein